MVTLEEKKVLLDKNSVLRVIKRMAYEIIEKNKGIDDLVVIGIQTKGVFVAKAIIDEIEKTEGKRLPLGSLDITFYRDDLTRLDAHPVVKESDISFTVEDKKIILVDDVLYSGRTIRAAIEEIFDMGRPTAIELAVLTDRGGRELPISADYVGKRVPSSKNEYIDVSVENGKIEKVSVCNMIK